MIKRISNIKHLYHPRVLLLTINIVAFITLLPLYIFAFDLQWGPNPHAFTWGIPLLLAIIWILVAAVGTYKSNKLAWGITGLIAIVIGVTHLGVMIGNYDAQLLAPPQNAPKEPPETVENDILSQFLSLKAAEMSEYRKNAYAIILADAYWSGVEKYTDDFYQGIFSEREVPNLKASLKEKGLNIDPLIDTFIERNLTPTRLTIESSLADGFFIDYDGRYQRFIDSQKRFTREVFFLFHRYNPSFMRVSSPIYEPETGAVLISFLGSYRGGLLYCDYQNNNLEILRTLIETVVEFSMLGGWWYRGLMAVFIFYPIAALIILHPCVYLLLKRRGKLVDSDQDSHL